MSYQTVSATPPAAVLIEARPDGMTADVWLRRNIEKDVADSGPEPAKAIEFYRADELHFTQVGVPTVDEVTAAFDELWEAHEADELTADERMAAMAARLDEQDAALMELGDMLGGE